MKTGINWRKFTRESKNGVTTEATYHGKYVYIFFFFWKFYSYFFFLLSRLNFEFVLNRGKSNETKYGFATREPLHGPIEYNKSYLKVKFYIFRKTEINFQFLFSIKMIMSFGLFINLNLGKLIFLHHFIICVCVCVVFCFFPPYYTYKHVEVFNLL